MFVVVGGVCGDDDVEQAISSLPLAPSLSIYIFCYFLSFIIVVVVDRRGGRWVRGSVDNLLILAHMGTIVSVKSSKPNGSTWPTMTTKRETLVKIAITSSTIAPSLETFARDNIHKTTNSSTILQN